MSNGLHHHRQRARTQPGVPIGLGFWRMRLTLPQNGIRDRFANAIRSDASGCASGTGKLIFRSLRRGGLFFLDPLDSAQAEPQDGQTKRAVAGLNSGNFMAIISRWN